MNVRKIHCGKKLECAVTCYQCGKPNRIDTTAAKLEQPIQIECKCGNCFSIQLEQREYYRKEVKLTGSYQRLLPENEEEGKLFIEDISYTGIGCRTVKKHNLNLEDVLQVEFALDDVHNSQLTENGIVKDIRDRYLGIKFQDLSQHNRKIIGFYLLPSSNSPKEYTEEDLIETPHTRYEFNERQVWNPFRFPEIPDAADLKGKLKSLGLPGIFQVLSLEHKSGVLHFIRGQTGRAICFRDGKIIAATGGECLRLGHILRNKRLISWEKLKEALERARDSNRRLGEVLLDLGLVSNDILKNTVRFQIQQTVSDLASWGEGEFEFRDCSVDFDNRSVDEIDTRTLIFEAARRVDESRSKPREITPTKKAREYARAKVSWPLSILTLQGPVEGEVRDISLTGALIHCRELPDPDKPIPMAIEIPEQQHSIFATGEMIRLDIEGAETDHPSFLLGVRFAEISDDDLGFLSQKILQ
ncbi:MAG: PilZ domain-containing protein [Deltaproteobacteria bacterium]|nr:PilZ domain-containing protein [Deltaproteobacteria bacterium]